MTTKVFKVNGMHCTSCEKLLNMAVEGIAGVSKAEASFSKGILTVEFDSSKAGEAAIKAAIKAEGYSA